MTVCKSCCGFLFGAAMILPVLAPTVAVPADRLPLLMPDDFESLRLVSCPVKAAGGFVALVSTYDASIQTMSLQLAASRDGIHWWRPDRRPALPNPPLGDYGGGMIWQMHRPIVEDGKMHVYYAGSEGIHGEIHDTRRGANSPG